jgi:NAD-dependent deacetylase
LRKVKPNLGHFAIAELESCFDVTVITQNVDDLHERAGSKNVYHLHGELLYARTSGNSGFRRRVAGDLEVGDCCDEGFQLRPDVVWFGEEVPLMEVATAVLKEASVLVVVGTSLQVYPAAALLYEAENANLIYVIDPKPESLTILPRSVNVIPKKASEGLQILKAHLLKKA